MRGGRLRKLSRCCPQAVDLDVDKLDKNIDRMMPELGFSPEDNDRLVASYSGGWQMRMCLGKILLQQPDLLLLDEPTNHLDLEAIEWLEGAAGCPACSETIISRSFYVSADCQGWYVFCGVISNLDLKAVRQ
jgi:ABC transporter